MQNEISLERKTSNVWKLRICAYLSNSLICQVYNLLIVITTRFPKKNKQSSEGLMSVGIFTGSINSYKTAHYSLCFYWFLLQFFCYCISMSLPKSFMVLICATWMTRDNYCCGRKPIKDQQVDYKVQTQWTRDIDMYVK